MDERVKSPRIRSALGEMPVRAAQERVLDVEDLSNEDIDYSTPQGRMQAFAKNAAQNTPKQEDLRTVAEGAHEERRQPRMEVGAKKRLELLLNLGRATKNVEIGGITFSLRTLKNIEYLEAVKSVSGADLAIEQAYNLRAEILSRSIYAVDGQDIDLVIGAETIGDKIAFVHNMDEAVVSHLNDCYNKLVSDNRIQFDISKADGVKEVHDQIKK